MSILDDMTELGLRCNYAANSDQHDFRLSFEEWKAKRMRPVPTNPATVALLDQIAEANIRAAPTATDINHD